ncbi:MAG: GTP-binding protein, partial [Bradyrhizobiaceae bacterium]|nr:GTP-binding protein [Bradyrhizobiaceae bacterium]
RLRSERGARIPVTIASGFLGAGKTTLIQHFLRTQEGRDTAVVVNEFGAIGIDDVLLRSSSEKTVLLGNGCLCCSTRSDLQIALRRLVAERARGEVSHFKRIVIETSGLADVGPILATFVSDRALGGEFHVQAVVTVIDAARATDTLDVHPEARKQAILADRIVLSKIDLTNATAIERLTKRLRVLNPRAEILTADHGAIDSAVFTAPAPGAPIPMVAIAGEASHGDGIHSFVLCEDQPMIWESFARTLETLIALRGTDLLRVKGFLSVPGARGPVVIQVVGHLAHPPIELQAWPNDDQRTRVVFVTRGIAERQVRDLLAAVRALSADGPEPPRAVP